jgi:hypothetical protein
MRALAALRRYAASDDPRVAAANLVALVLAWNTPFYPLYLWGSAGAGILPGGWLTLCVFPVFLSVPKATRRWPLSGRVLLVLAGTGNTLFCTWLLGEASGTQLFLVPCVSLAALLFRRAERVPLFGLLALPIVAGVALNGRYPVSPFVCAAASCSGIVWLNAVSVGILAAFLGVLATGLAGSDDSVILSSASAPPTRPPATRRP